MSNETEFKAIEIPEDKRLDFLPKHVRNHFSMFEQYLYTFSEKITDDYEHGFWNFYELDNQRNEEDILGFFLAPNKEKTYHCVSLNGAVKDFDAQTFGIVMTLFAINRLCFDTENTEIINKYYALRDYVLNYHQNRADIADFID